MTTGAIYGNSKNRDELFIALGHAYWPPVAPKVPPGATAAGCCCPPVLYRHAIPTGEVSEIGFLRR